MRKVAFATAVVVGLVWVCGLSCVDAKAPERIYIGGGPRAQEDVNSSRVPQTGSLDECQAELNKAYNQIRYLENENRRLREKYEEAKRDKEEYKDRYERGRGGHDD